jgi:hydrogenase maturation protease
MTEFTPSTVVLGLGNLMRTDDGVGMHAVSRLARDPRLPHGVRVVEGGTLGPELIYHVQDSRCLLVLDAVDASEEPGTVMRFSGDAISQLPSNRSVHLVGLIELLNALKALGRAPMEVVLLGVQPKSTGWGTTLTSPVETALDFLVDSAILQLSMWPPAPTQSSTRNRPS